MIKGKVGQDVTVEQAYEAARSCALALLGTLEREVDDLDSVRIVHLKLYQGDRSVSIFLTGCDLQVQIIKVTGYINCTENFTEHSQVMNGASDFLVQVFGEGRGSHTRSGTRLTWNWIVCFIPFKMQIISLPIMMWAYIT